MVIRQDQRFEARDVLILCVVGELVEQMGSYAPVLVGVLDRKRDFGGRLCPIDRQVVAADADDLMLVDGHEGHPLPIVEVREVFDFFGRQAILGSEEAVVDALTGHPGHHQTELLSVVRSDRSQSHHAAVAERHVE